MDFQFSEEQRMFERSLREFLAAELPTERIRGLWDSERGRSDALWRSLAELGVLSVLVPESDGGLGLDERDFVLLAETCGYAALPEPLVDSALLSAPLLAAVGGEVAQRWLPALLAGEVRVAVATPLDLLVADADGAAAVLLAGGSAGDDDGELRLLVAPPADALHRQDSVDPSRRLFSRTPLGGGDLIAEGDTVRQLWARALNRGALGAAAQQLGAAARVLEYSVAYASERKQFGRAIGSFQAVRNQLADVAVALEFARPVVYRAADSLARGVATAARDVSHAWLAAGEAARMAARHGIQSHGAIGYTWELDLQIWLKRIWATDALWGGRAWHSERLETAVFSPDVALGAGHTFDEGT